MDGGLGAFDPRHAEGRPQYNWKTIALVVFVGVIIIGSAAIWHWQNRDRHAFIKAHRDQWSKECGRFASDAVAYSSVHKIGGRHWDSLYDDCMSEKIADQAPEP